MTKDEQAAAEIVSGINWNDVKSIAPKELASQITAALTAAREEGRTEERQAVARERERGMCNEIDCYYDYPHKRH